MLKMLVVVVKPVIIIIIIKMIHITLLPIPNQIQSQPKQNLIQDRRGGELV